MRYSRYEYFSNGRTAYRRLGWAKNAIKSTANPKDYEIHVYSCIHTVTVKFKEGGEWSEETS